MVTGPTAIRPGIVIGVCTSGRLGLLGELLDHLGRLSLVEREPERVHLMVVDNHPAGSAEALVREFGARGRVEVVYRHVPERGLALARNAVLDGATQMADLLAFIDDDEAPEPWWLDELLLCRTETEASIITGPVFPRIPVGAPEWLVDGGFLELDVHPDRTTLNEAISGNALLHLPTVNRLGLRFDPLYNRTGGEDQLFFRQAHAGGAVIRYAARATVYEAVPPERTTFRFLVRRELRKGNTLGLIARDHPELGEGRFYRSMAAAKWFTRGAGVGMLGVVAGRNVQSRRGFLSAVRAIGMIGGLVGWRYALY
ncbi:MAG TPA: glycosyltransferase [Acidimicrobiales bacterium]|nr:glycosyltransferase [Acidimicrobiales bacterium]